MSDARKRDAKAIKVGTPIPTGYKEAAKTHCRKCHEMYLIIHEVREALGDDKALAKRQAIYIKGYLTGEHVDAKNNHLEVYEPLDDPGEN